MNNNFNQFVMDQLTKYLTAQIEEERSKIKCFNKLFVQNGDICNYCELIDYWSEEKNCTIKRLVKIKYYHKEFDNLILLDKYGIKYKIIKSNHAGKAVPL